MVSEAFGTLLALLVWALYRLLRVGRRPKGYPPGPPTTPILGNLLQVSPLLSDCCRLVAHFQQMPMHDPHLQFQKWAQEYGPIYSLILGTKVMIVLSKDYVMKDLLDKRSAIYSSRPDLYIMQTIMSGGHRMLITVGVRSSLS